MSAETELLEIEMMRGGDPSLIRDELLYVIRTQISAHPRSQQKQIGPSEVGTPCQRRLGYRLAGVDAVNAGPRWRPTVGTAVHTWLEAAFTADNARIIAEGGQARWLIEARLDVGEIAAEQIKGKCDIFDRVTAYSIDWKIVGAATLKAVRSSGDVGAKYRAQGHLYGRGWARRGLPIDGIAVFFLPSSGELSDGYFWSERYNESIATDALQAANTVAAVLAAVGPGKALPIFTTADDHCTYCPWFMPASSVLEQACPGHVASPPKREALPEQIVLLPN